MVGVLDLRSLKQAVFASARQFQQAAQELLNRLEAKNC